MSTEENPPKSIQTDIPQVHFPAGREREGFLVLHVGSDSITVRLTPGRARLLLTLIEARERDTDRPVEAQGWRHSADIARRMAELVPGCYRVEEQTVRAYLCRIRAEVRKASKGALPSGEIYDVFESRRGLGVRIRPHRIIILDKIGG